MNKIFKGIVADNNDPEKLGRIRVRSDEIMGGQLVAGWVVPMISYGGDNVGFVFVPPLGSVVDFLFESGDRRKPRYISSLHSLKDALPEIFKTNYPKRKGIAVAVGHIFWDEKTGECQIVSPTVNIGEIIANVLRLVNENFLPIFNAHLHGETGRTTTVPLDPNKMNEDLHLTKKVKAE